MLKRKYGAGGPMTLGAPPAPPAPPAGPTPPAGQNMETALWDMLPYGSAIAGNKLWRSMQPALGQTLNLARGLDAEQRGRYDRGLSLGMESLNRARKADAGMGEDEISARMGRTRDAAAGQSLDQWKALRDHLGGAGITGGGLGAGLGSQIELGRLAQIQGGKRDLAIAEMERRSQAASNDFLRTMGMAQYMNQDVPMLELDQSNSLVDMGLNTFLGSGQLDLGWEGLKASKKAAKQSMIGGILGGGLSLLGSI